MLPSLHHFASPSIGHTHAEACIPQLQPNVVKEFKLSRKVRPLHDALTRLQTATFDIARILSEADRVSRVGDAITLPLPPTYQAAWADVNRDGNLDLLTAGKLYMNKRAQVKDAGHWIELRLIGDGVRVNRGAVGAQARLTLPDGHVLSRQIEVGTGEGNSNSPILHFGVGATAGPFKVEIRWPGAGNDLVQMVEGVAVDQKHTVQMNLPSP